MTKFIFHIGPHKTGTTYLQSCFRRSRARLRSYGVTYPQEWAEGRLEVSHHPLAILLAAGKTEQLREQFEELQEFGTDRILISTENLSRVGKKEVRQLKALTADAKVEIIFYVRRWSGLLPSAWQQRVKGGLPRTLPDFMDRRIAKPSQSKMINYELILAPYIDVFGLDAIRFVSFDEVRAQKLDLFEHFLRHVLNIEAKFPAIDRRPNASWPTSAAELTRALNAIAENERVRLNRRISFLLDHYADQLELDPILDILSAHIAYYTLNDAEPGLDKLHSDLAERLRPRMVHPLPPERLFTPSQESVPYVDSAYEENPDAQHALKTLFARLRELDAKVSEPAL